MRYCRPEIVVLLALGLSANSTLGQYDAVAETRGLIRQLQVGAEDWPQMGGSPLRNSVGGAAALPANWDVATGQNIRWSVRLGSTTYGNPVVANGKVFVGTNNGGGYLERFPTTVDLGVLLCFDERDGRFLWQHSAKNWRREASMIGPTKGSVPRRWSMAVGCGM